MSTWRNNQVFTRASIPLQPKAAKTHSWGRPFITGLQTQTGFLLFTAQWIFHSFVPKGLKAIRDVQELSQPVAGETDLEPCKLSQKTNLNLPLLIYWIKSLQIERTSPFSSRKGSAGLGLWSECREDLWAQIGEGNSTLSFIQRLDRSRRPYMPMYFMLPALGRSFLIWVSLGLADERPHLPMHYKKN